MRERTHAWHKVEKGLWKDDVEESIKKRRLKEIVDTYREIAQNKSIKQDSNQIKLVLVEGPSKKSLKNQKNKNADSNNTDDMVVQLTGRTDTFKRCVFNDTCPSSMNGQDIIKLVPGDYVAVKIGEGDVTTLKGTPMYKTTLQKFEQANRV